MAAPPSERALQHAHRDVVLLLQQLGRARLEEEEEERERAEEDEEEEEEEGEEGEEGEEARARERPE